MSQIDVNTTIRYLARSETYQREKPYVVTFPVTDISEAKSSNHCFQSQPCTVRDARGLGNFDLDACGFTFTEHRTLLSLEEFQSPKIVESAYYSELTQFIHSHFPQFTDLVFLDYEVRRVCA